MVTNKINRFYGIVGLIGGILFTLTGFWAMFYTIKGILLVLIGAFIGFTNECTTIDTVQKKLRHTFNWMGFIPSGDWIEIKSRMKLEIKKPDYSYLMAGKKKRLIEKGDNFYYLLLFDENDKFIMPVKKYKRKQDAEEDYGYMKILVGLV